MANAEHMKKKKNGQMTRTESYEKKMKQLTSANDLKSDNYSRAGWDWTLATEAQAFHNIRSLKFKLVDC